VSAGSGDSGNGVLPDAMAAEYVLGTLSADERAVFERSLVVDPAAQAAVLDWERRLTPLSLAVPDENPPAGLWERIARTLPDRPGEAANDNRLVVLGHQVRRWRMAATGAGLVTAGLALFVALDRRQAGEAGSRYVSVVTGDGALPALIVSIDTAAGTAQVRPVKAETPNGRSLELWYVGTDKTPKPLGLIGASARRILLPEGAKAGEGAFAVSVEPQGGSPSGQPTGPVIYTGTLIHD